MIKLNVQTKYLGNPHEDAEKAAKRYNNSATDNDDKQSEGM